MLCLQAEMLKISCRFYVAEKIKLIGRTLFSTFTANDFYAHESHGDTGTLYTRFVKYLAIENCKFDPILPQTIKYSDFYPLHDTRNFNHLVEDIPIEQIPRLIIFTYTYKTNGDLHKVAHALSKIDEISARKVEILDYDAILRTLQAFMYVIPNKITKLQFYEKGMRKLVDEFDPSFPKEKFVQTCFYLGLWKKNIHSNKLMKAFLISHLPTYLDQLTALDLAIVSNAAYKTSVLVNINEFNERILQETERASCKDDALLVTFIKWLRFNRIKSPKIYEKLTAHLLRGEMDGFHFKGLTHCFAYFAEGLWNDSKVCKTMIKKCLDRMQETDLVGDDGVFNDLRAKDFANFLWCCANLSVNNLSEADLSFIEAVILKKIERNEYRYCADDLIDSALSLWMLGHKSRGIVSSILKLKQIPSVRKSERIKLDSRFRLLLNCVHIEKPKWLAKEVKNESSFIENRAAQDFLITNRTALQMVERVLNEHKNELGIISNAIVCPVGEINIANILVETNQGKLYLEVLEKNHLLRFTDKPISIIQLRVNLLEHLGYNVKLIGPNEYDCGDELLPALKKKLNFEDAPLNKETAVV